MATVADVNAKVAEVRASVEAEIARVEALLANVPDPAALDQVVTDLDAIKAIADAERP